MCIVSTGYLFSEMLSPFKRMSSVPDRKGEYAVITGGNRGIGWHTVKGLVGAGMSVIVGCRDGASKDLLLANVEKELPAGSVEWIDLDMSSMDSVRSFAQNIITKGIPIHLLINNAGIMFVDYSVTKDGFESHFAVNYLGHFLLTHLLLPQLRMAGREGQAARVVSVSSSAQHFGWFRMNDLQSKEVYSKPGAYSQSKAAQVMFTKSLDAILAAEGAHVRCYAMHPGFIRSNLYNQAWYAKMTVVANGCMFKSEAQGADRVLYTALSPEIEDLNGSYFENCHPAKPVANARSVDNQKKLWDISCNLLAIEKF